MDIELREKLKKASDSLEKVGYSFCQENGNIELKKNFKVKTLDELYISYNNYSRTRKYIGTKEDLKGFLSLRLSTNMLGNNMIKFYCHSELDYIPEGVMDVETTEVLIKYFRKNLSVAKRINALNIIGDYNEILAYLMDIEIQKSRKRKGGNAL